MTAVIALAQLAKTYAMGPLRIDVLADVSLSVAPGEFVAITGRSGSGKSTLLNLLGLLDRADRGSYHLDGRAIGAMSDDELTILRNRKIGFIFQAAPMFPRLTTVENVAITLLYRGSPAKEAEAQAARMLERVGLGAFTSRRPAQLSGGQLQRVAVARALVGQPKLILADEPTASLDDQAAAEVMTLLLECNRSLGAALVLITHQPREATGANRSFRLEGGSLVPSAAVEPMLATS